MASSLHPGLLSQFVGTTALPLLRARTGSRGPGPAKALIVERVAMAVSAMKSLVFIGCVGFGGSVCVNGNGFHLLTHRSWSNPSHFFARF